MGDKKNNISQNEGAAIQEDDEVTIVSDKDVMNEERGGDSGAAILKLKKKIAACEKERQEYLLGWQRAKADFVNARREEEEMRKKLFSLAKEDVLFSFLPIADSFLSAFRNKESWENVPEVWRKGIEYIHAQFSKILQENGAREFAREGDVFDPARHESVELVPTEDEAANGTIVEVLQKGYELDGKVIRPARVKVGEFQAKM